MTIHDLRIAIYKPTLLHFDLVNELTDKLIHCFGDKIEVTSIKLDDNTLTLDDNLKVRMIEIDPEEIGAVLIHWYPQNKTDSSDYFCSAYMLTTNELKKIITFLQNVKNNYLQFVKK